MLQRIGVLKNPLASWNPSWVTSSKEAIEASLSFSLTSQEEERELQRAEAAIAQIRLDRTRLNEESPRLQAEERFGIQDVEERIARGRYLSNHELRRLLTAWATRNGGWVETAEQGAAIDLKVSLSMLRALATWKLRLGRAAHSSAWSNVNLHLDRSGCTWTQTELGRTAGYSSTPITHSFKPR